MLPSRQGDRHPLSSLVYVAGVQSTLVVVVVVVDVAVDSFQIPTPPPFFCTDTPRQLFSYWGRARSATRAIFRTVQKHSM